MIRCPTCVAAALLLISGCSEEKPPAPPEPRLVRTLEIVPETIEAAGDTVGDIEARITVNVGFQIGGRLIERKVDLGAVVKKGDLLARIDPSDEQNKVLAAEAQLRGAQAVVEQEVPQEARFRQLLADGWTTPMKYEDVKKGLMQAQAQVADARAQLDLAKAQLSYTELHAQDEGVVTATRADPGQVVVAGQTVVQMANPNDREAVFAVADKVIGYAHPGMPVEVSLKDNPSIVTEGSIRDIAPNADPITRTYTVKVSLPSPPDAMRLGVIIVGRPDLPDKVVTRIPAGALLQTGDQPAVWIVAVPDNVIRKRDIEVLRYDTDAVLVGSGLAKGDLLVTAGINSVSEGEKVRLAAGATK